MKKLKKKKLSKNLLSGLLVGFLVLLGFVLGVNIDKLNRLSTLLVIPKVAAGETISSAQLRQELSNKSFTFINVHTPYEGEIEKTDMFIAYDEMMANKDKLPKDKNASIILYCKTGKMSAQALQTLKGMGYTNVRHLTGGMDAWQKAGREVLDLSKLAEAVLPKAGVTLPVSWNDLGPRLVKLGVIDMEKFEKAVNLNDEQRKILNEGGDISVKIDSGNGQFVVDLLWALGLAQKSIVYEEGPMGPTSPEASRGKQDYKGWVGNFASTGGWTLARGNAVNYLNKFDLIPLTSDQQKKVGEIAKNVYRPCCGNSTWFPDCNHGMAALAAIELMVAKGISEEEIYRNLLALNSYWFPDTYLTTATYFARQGIEWPKVDAKKILGQEFSSAQGAGEVARKVGPLPYGGQAGGSCGT